MTLRICLVLAALIGLAATLSACGSDELQYSQSPPTLTPYPTPSPTPTATPIPPTPTPYPTPSPTPTATPIPPTPTPYPTPSPTPTATPIPPTPTPYPTPSPTPTATPIPPTPTPYPTPSPTPTATPIPPTPTPYPTPSPTPTATPIPPTPTPYPTPSPTPIPPTATPIPPTPTLIPHPHIESHDGNILIIYELPVTQEEMEFDLARAQHLTGELAKVYGRLPYGQLVLKKKSLREQWDGSYMPVQRISILFDLCESFDSGEFYCRFPAHELGRYFTWNLLGTDQLWFGEGLSIVTGIVAGIAEVDGIIDLKLLDMVAHDELVHARFPHTAAKDYYDKLKSKKNIFKVTECTAILSNEEGGGGEVGWPCIDWLGAHSAGYMFFYALAKDYGINGARIGEFVRALVDLAEDGRSIGPDDLRTAAQEVSGKDIKPLLNLLEPAIKFNGYNDAQNGVYFIMGHPEYAADETLWVD